MEYTRLGTSGLKVSRICLGMMSYGDPEWREWVLSEEAGRPFVQRALELGINFFDTADVYSLGVSEEVTGRALRDFARRDAGGHRHQGACPDERRPERRRAVAQAHPGLHRRLAAAAGHRLRGSLPDPPLRQRDAHRGDDGGAERRGAGPARRATSARRACTPGSSPRRCTWPSSTAGRGSSRCRTTTT